VAPQGSIAILMFHDGVTVSVGKLNMSWILEGIVADDGTSKYTEKRLTASSNLEIKKHIICQIVYCVVRRCHRKW
jgi:hypothetical protein